MSSFLREFLIDFNSSLIEFGSQCAAIYMNNPLANTPVMKVGIFSALCI